jgi:hypothetical protein
MNLLKKNKIKVTFNKSDGTERTMVCLPYDAVPQTEQVKDSNQKRENNPTLVTVYEEGVGWRSFHSTKVISYEVIE